MHSAANAPIITLRIVLSFHVVKTGAAVRSHRKSLAWDGKATRRAAVWITLGQCALGGAQI